MFLIALIAWNTLPTGNLRGFLEMRLSYLQATATLDSTGTRVDGVVMDPLLPTEGQRVNRFHTSIRGGIRVWSSMEEDEEEKELLRDTSLLRALPPSWQKRFAPSKRPSRSLPMDLWMMIGLHAQRLALQDPYIQLPASYRIQAVEGEILFRIAPVTVGLGIHLDGGPDWDNPNLSVYPNSDNQHALWVRTGVRGPVGPALWVGLDMQYIHLFPQSGTLDVDGVPVGTYSYTVGNRLDVGFFGEIVLRGFRAGLSGLIMYGFPPEILQTIEGERSKDRGTSRYMFALIPHIAYRLRVGTVDVEGFLEGGGFREYQSVGYALVGKNFPLYWGVTAGLRLMFVR